MVLHLRLEPRQTQKIVITPQLRQAIKLLQLSAIELQSYIENEIRENPLLSADERPELDIAAAGIAPDIVANGNSETDIPAFDAREVAGAELHADWEPETHADPDTGGELPSPQPDAAG